MSHDKEEKAPLPAEESHDVEESEEVEESSEQAASIREIKNVQPQEKTIKRYGRVTIRVS